MTATDRIREAVQRGPFSAHERAAYVSAWEAEALCDLADAARALSDGYDFHCACPGDGTCEWCRLRAVLARLDGEDSL